MLGAFLQIMKDMERWAKIQNQKKESCRAPSPVLKSGMEDDKRQSKSADVAFAVFERKVGDSSSGFTTLENMQLQHFDVSLCCLRSQVVRILSRSL